MRRKRLPQMAEEEQGMINLTPLIDVVFVVLIMFILIAPMLELDRVHLAAAPERESREKVIVQESSSLVIHVHENNSIWVNHRQIPTEKLGILLQTVRKQYPKLTPQLYQDKKAQFGTYQVVKNAVEEAGFEELDVILQPEK